MCTLILTTTYSGKNGKSAINAELPCETSVLLLHGRYEMWKLIFTLLTRWKCQQTVRVRGEGVEGSGLSPPFLPVLFTAVLKHIPVGCPDWCWELLSCASWACVRLQTPSEPQEGPRTRDGGLCGRMWSTLWSASPMTHSLCAWDHVWKRGECLLSFRSWMSFTLI